MKPMKDIYSWVILAVGQALGLGASINQGTGDIDPALSVFDGFIGWFWHIFIICVNGIVSGAIISTVLFAIGVVVVKIGLKQAFVLWIHKQIEKYNN